MVVVGWDVYRDGDEGRKKQKPGKEKKERNTSKLGINEDGDVEERVGEVWYINDRRAEHF